MAVSTVEEIARWRIVNLAKREGLHQKLDCKGGWNWMTLSSHYASSWIRDDPEVRLEPKRHPLASMHRSAKVYGPFCCRPWLCGSGLTSIHSCWTFLWNHGLGSIFFTDTATRKLLQVKLSLFTEGISIDTLISNYLKNSPQFKDNWLSVAGQITAGRGWALWIHVNCGKDPTALALESVWTRTVVIKCWLLKWKEYHPIFVSAQPFRMTRTWEALLEAVPIYSS